MDLHLAQQVIVIAAIASAITAIISIIITPRLLGERVRIRRK